MTRTETYRCPACGGDLVADIAPAPAPHPADCWNCRAGLEHVAHLPRLRPHECSVVTTAWVDTPGTIESATAAAHERYWVRPQESKI